jgi:hypothetical protein
MRKRVAFVFWESNRGWSREVNVTRVRIEAGPSFYGLELSQA